MRRILVLLLLLTPALAAGEVYKWIDGEGKVIYSDRPTKGAQALGLPAKKGQPVPEGPVPGQPWPGPYDQFEVLTPEASATVRDADGNVQVGLLLEPALLEGHRLQILADGTPVAGDLPGTQIRIKGLPFGSHQLQAQILDAEGATIASSSVVHFHLRKPDTP